MKSTLVSIASLGLIATSNAAVIAWGSATNVSSNADVSTTGTVVEAINAAADSVTTDRIVNGVTFTSASLLPLTSTSDVYTGSITGDYELLLSNVDFGGGVNTSITIGGGALTNGNQYEVQVWFADTRAAQAGRILRVSDGEIGGNSVDLLAGSAQYSIGTFTADGTSQTLGLEATNFGNAHITAYQLREVVPEPSSALLALFGIAGLIRRKR